MTQDIEYAPGVVSMMRRGVRAALRAAGWLIAAGIALAAGMLLLDRYELASLAVVMVSTGAGLIPLSLGAKAWQAQAESREAAARGAP